VHGKGSITTILPAFIDANGIGTKIGQYKLALSEQMGVVTAIVIRTQLIERHANVLAEVLDCFQIQVNRGGSVVAADEFLPHSLHEWCHRDLLSLRQRYLSNFQTTTSAQVGDSVQVVRSRSIAITSHHQSRVDPRDCELRSELPCVQQCVALKNF
jgi:hypothetical protein